MSTKRSRDIRSAAFLTGFMLIMALGTIQAVFPYLEIFLDIDIHGVWPVTLSTLGLTIFYLFLASINAGSVLFFIWVGAVLLYMGLLLIKYGFGLYAAFRHSWVAGTAFLTFSIILTYLGWLWRRYRR